MKGRVSSLLEVGTGFHPELTGRENIYLNGTILGMSRSEIRAKFDEIVSFSGVEKFIDTPVKRYSSGMYVRLAFSVAAHLEPEILIIDEVLAVGDAEFQKKCLGKMKDVSGHGRTVIFVSHNMSAVKSLCNKAIFLKNGQLIDFGDTAKVVNKYLNNEVNSQLSSQWNDINTAPGNEFVKLNKIEILSNNNENDFFVNHEIVIQFKFWYLLNSGLVNVSLHLYSASGDLVFAAASNGYELSTTIASFKAIIPPNLLNDGMYTISMMVVKDSKELYTFHECLTFEIKDLPRASGWYGKWPGLVRPTLKWEFDNITV
jgi:lipopolysaccharide transport system ATP-binding protein